jgi:integrase/recombinase XerC
MDHFQFLNPTQPLTRQLTEAMTDAWLVDQDVTDLTKRVYQRCLRPWWKWFLRQQLDRPPTREDILAYKRYLSSNVKKAHTMRGYIANVQRFFAWAAAKGICPTNIAHGTKRIPLPRNSTRDALTVEQAQKLFASIDTSKLVGLRDLAITSLMVGCGPRPVSVVEAKLLDLRAVGNATVLFIRNKSSVEADEFCVLVPSVLERIEHYIKARLKEGPLEPDAPLFASHSDANMGSHISTRTISRIIKIHLRKIGLDRATLCAGSCRNTAATFALLGGASIHSLQKMLHHSGPAMSIRYATGIRRVTDTGESAEFRIDALLKTPKAS